MSHQTGFRRAIANAPLFAGLLLGVIAGAGRATAQETGAKDAPKTDVVVITAQKREERLQDAPLAVTAVSADTLQQSQVAGTSNLGNVAPSLTFQQGNNVTNTNFRIRGVGTAVFGQWLESSVAVVLDGVGMARGAQGFTDLADIERVEVLRGPQGTLIGQNATAGALNVVTRAPSRTFEADAKLTYAEGDEKRIGGSVSGPLGDMAALRVSGYYNDIEGQTTNVYNGQKVNGQTSHGIRGKLRFEPTDKFDSTLTIDYRSLDAQCCQTTFRVIAPLSVTTQGIAAGQNPYANLVLPIVASPTNNQVKVDTPTTNTTRQTTISLEANYDLDSAVLTSVTGYQIYHANNNVDSDALVTVTPLNLIGNNDQQNINGGPVKIAQFTEELRIANSGHDKLNYVAGLYYLQLDVERGFIRRQGLCPTVNGQAAFAQPCAAPTYSSSTYLTKPSNTNIAAFGQLDYEFLPNLSAIVGLRAQTQKISYDAVRNGPAALTSPCTPNQGPAEYPTDCALMIGSRGSGSHRDNDISGKLGLKYEFTPDAQAYLTWTRGYKGEGFDTDFGGAFENITPVRPETVKAWEAGFKTLTWDDRLSLNLALFYANYTDLQVQAFDPAVQSVQLLNAGESVTQGLEAEFTLALTDHLSINGGLTKLDTSVDMDGFQCAVQYRNPTSSPFTATPAPNTCFRTTATSANYIQNLRGVSLPNAPEWRGNLSIRYQDVIPGTQVGWFAQLIGRYQSAINFTLEQDPNTVQKEYTLLDANLGLEMKHYKLTAFGRNLADQSYVTTIASAPTSLTSAANPGTYVQFIPKDAQRYYGVTLALDF